jgi:hypothetical protein
MNTSKLWRKALAVRALPLLFALAATTVGCGHAAASDVAQGRQYQSGDPTYDQFFTAVHDLQVQMGKAPAKEEELRMALGKALGVEPEEIEEPASAPAGVEPEEIEEPASAPAAAPATPDPARSATPSPTDAYKKQLVQSAIHAVPGGATVNAVSQQVHQLEALFGGARAVPAATKPAAAPAPAAPPKKRFRAPSASILAKALVKKRESLGLELKLDVDRSGLESGEAKVKLRSARELEGDSEDLAKLVETTAANELELLAKMKKAEKKLGLLAKMSATLEANIDQTFRKSRSQASEVRKNLADAKALIELMQARTKEVGRKAENMLSKLEDSAKAELPAAEPEKNGTAVAKAEPAAEPKKETPAEPKAKPEKTTKPDKAEKTATPEKAEPKAKPEKTATPEKAEPKAKPEKTATPDKAEKTATPEKKHNPRAASRPAAPVKKTAMADFEP